MSDVARLRKRLVVRLIKLRGLNLLRTAFVGFLMCHVRGVKLKLFCTDLWGRRDKRMLETLLKIWRSFAASKKLRHAANDWALVRHHVRRNVHRAFVKLLANRAMRVKNRVDRKGGRRWARARVIAKAFWGLHQAATYLKSVRVRTMAFVYEGSGNAQTREVRVREERSDECNGIRRTASLVAVASNTVLTSNIIKYPSLLCDSLCSSQDLPLAMGDDEARRACKQCRDRVAAEILALRDTKVDNACRRAVGVGGRWGPHQMPDQLRYKNYVVTDARLGGKWVSSYVYDPLRSYLKPSVMLDAGGAGGKGKPDGLNLASESDNSEFRRTFLSLKRGFEAETTTSGRRRKLGRMIRVLDSFMARGVAEDALAHVVKLPGGEERRGAKYGRGARSEAMKRCECPGDSLPSALTPF